jgi:tetratricopeptide (TPR) repeat protein
VDRRAKFRQFWQDLKRREIFRTGVIYSVVAWAIVQAASIAFPAFGVPDWAMRALLVAAFAGFPVAIVLAWVFDVTPRGIGVTPPSGEIPASPGRPPRWWLRPLVAAPVMAGIVGATAWLWTSDLSTRGESEFTRQLRPDELPIVAVLPLENLTGRKELEWAGTGLANLIRDDLAQSRFLAVVSDARTLRLSRNASDLDRLFTTAAESGITHVLTGEILRTPKGLTVTSRLTDLRRNVELGANRRENLEPDAVLTVSTAVASLVKQSLGLPGTEKVDVFAADFATRNIAAYEAFVAGMENFLRYNYADARHGFEVAVQKAPDFAMARYRLAHTLAALGDTDAALEHVLQAQQNAYSLPARDRAYIDAGASYIARDYAAAARQYRELLDDYPYESEARLLLLYVLVDEEQFEKALVEAETLTAQDPGDEVAWSAVADLRLKLGRYDEADEPIAKFLALSPDNPNAHFLDGDARYFRQHFDEARRAYQKALELDPGFIDAKQRMAQIDVLQGQSGRAIEMLVKTARTDSVAAGSRTTAAIDAADLLRAEGRCAEAEALLVGLEPQFVSEQISVGRALTIRALCKLDAGDAVTARALASEAITKAVGAAPRFFLTRARAEIAARDLDAAMRTAGELRAMAGDDGQAQPAALKAANYVEGLVQLERGDARAAARSMRAAVELAGKEFEIYRLGLARALAAGGDAREARRLARDAGAMPDPVSLSFDLEPSRREATRLLAAL